MSFTIGNTYSREGIQNSLGVPAARRDASWNTGYTRYDGEVYIFCTVGIAGRAGHDYPNRWDGKELIWFGKIASTVKQPLMKAMVAGRIPVHIFWRDQEYGRFTYAGVGRTVHAQSTSPVQIRWSLHAA
jgi:putative restriction endonuclease